jgi:hypothetical protein
VFGHRLVHINTRGELLDEIDLDILSLIVPQRSESTEESQSNGWSGTGSCIFPREAEGCCSPVVMHDGYWAWHPVSLLA